MVHQTVEIGYGGSERLTMNMGPQHPSAHGVFRAILTLEGETVVGVDAVIGYLHRCHEKLGETLTYVQYPSIASKTDYVAAMTAELAYVSAVELVGKIDVPKRAQWLRVLAAELQRVASHCLWLGTWCMDMGGALGGGATVFLYGCSMVFISPAARGTTCRPAGRSSVARRSTVSSNGSASTRRCSKTTRSFSCAPRASG